MNIKIILTGGGTAGHIMPVILLAKHLKQNNEEVLYVGSNSGMEKMIAEKNKIPFTGIAVGKWRNYFDLANIIDLFKTPVGLIQSYFLLKKFKPNVVFAKGGYVTFPILYWTKKMRIPLVIHESDIVPGRANLWAARFANKICVGFPKDLYPKLPQEKLVYTGIPVEFEKKEFRNNRKTILITGGSQGSSFLNKTILAILPALLAEYEVFHLIGKNDYPVFSKMDVAKDEHYHPMDFSNDMASLIGQADLIVSRAGAGTLTEIAAYSKAAILVPYRAAASDHQSLNAQFFKKNDAAEIMEEKSLTPDSLLAMIRRLMEDNSSRRAMGENANKFFVNNSVERIAQTIREVL